MGKAGAHGNSLIPFAIHESNYSKTKSVLKTEEKMYMMRPDPGDCDSREPQSCEILLDGYFKVLLSLLIKKAEF